MTKGIAIEYSTLKEQKSHSKGKKSFKAEDELYPENWLRAIIYRVIISN